MPGGAFNTAALIRELGLKPVGPDEMRVLTTIQPTMDVANLSDHTPVHKVPTAMFGATIQGLAGESGVVQVQSLAPGGIFIEDLIIAGAQNVVATTNLAPLAGVIVVVLPACLFSDDPIVSSVLQGSVPAILPPRAQLRAASSIYAAAGPNGWFIPKGTFFRISTSALAVSTEVIFTIREVPAAPNVQ